MSFTTKKIKQWGIYFLVLFLIQEGVVRYCFPTPEISNLDRTQYMVGSEKGVKFLRTLPFYWQSQLDTNHIFYSYMNQYGFRGDEWKIAKPENNRRAMFVGDSFVEGIMAEQDESIPEVFAEASGDKQYEVLNCGMAGVDLNTDLQLITDLVPVFKPNVVFLCIYANDLGKADPAIPTHFKEFEYFDAWKPRVMEFLQLNGKYNGLQFRFNSTPILYLPAVPHEHNPWTVNGEELVNRVRPEVADAMRKGEFNPYLAEHILKEKLYLANTAHLGEAIPFLKYTCNKYGAEPVVVYIPSRNQLTDYYLEFEKSYCSARWPEGIDMTTPQYQRHQRELTEQCKQFGVPFLDLTKILQQEEQKGNHLYWDYDQHMRSNGYKKVGETLWGFWSALR